MAQHSELKLYVARPSNPQGPVDGEVTEAVNAGSILEENVLAQLLVTREQIEQENGYRLRICRAIHRQAVELLGGDQVLVRDLVTGEETVRTADNERIKRRIFRRYRISKRRRLRLCFFRGAIGGNLVLFRKRRRRSPQRLARLWREDIEPATGVSEQQAEMYRWATGPYYNRLLISATDMSDAQRDELNEEPKQYYVDWRNDLGLSALQIAAIEDRSKFVDIRAYQTYDLATILRVKP